MFTTIKIICVKLIDSPKVQLGIVHCATFFRRDFKILNEPNIVKYLLNGNWVKWIYKSKLSR